MRILAVVGERRFARLYEPFAGSAALTLAGAARGVADAFVIGDSLAPLVAIWEQALAEPDALADRYGELWRRQDFAAARAEFNAAPEPARLLYLLARCVKNAPRFGPRGFNQSADRRRLGMNPDKMRRELVAAGRLLGSRTATFAGDAERCLATAGPADLVYLDPPWQGTTEGADKRYHQGFGRARLEALLAELNERGVPWLLSYDGRSGARTYGPSLPPGLWGAHLALDAGRSSQSTLSGRAELTIESLYVSASLRTPR